MHERTFAFSIALVIFALDQLAKWIVSGPLRLQEVMQIYIVPFFNLTWTENNGISLGLLNAETAVGRWMLVALTSAIAIGVAIWIGREKHRWDQAALGMILGGALGNILDRVRHGFVVDFADLHFGTFRPFLVFNVGDAAISIGVVILLVRAFLIKDEHKKLPKESVENA
ncbi:MAG TPA: signal peptidase II [Sphingomicrobium sp.]|nr:signal peptidase II [Sphingomicrobium sp.]